MNRLPTGFPVLPLLAFFIFAFVTTSAAQQGQCEKKFTTLVFGDSIAWGQGLDDEDKFVNIVDRWLQTRVGATCVHMHAHAGATIDEPGQNNSILAKIQPEESLNTTPKDAESLLDDKFDMTGIGEVNISYPTIPEQVRRATEDAASVDLIIMDGCINDVNFRYLVNAANTEKDVEALVTTYCRDSMTRLLRDTAQKFPAANIIVTGYFPLVYGDEERVKTNSKGEQKTYNVGGSANNLITRKAISVVRAGRTTLPQSCDKKKGAGKDAQRTCIAHLSDVWFKESNKALADAIQMANTTANGRIYFVPLSFPSWFAFSTKQSMLWNLGFGSTGAAGFRKVMSVLFVQGLRGSSRPNDRTREQRGAQCKKVYDEITSRFKARRNMFGKTEREELEKSMGGFMMGCKGGSLGHPNKFGAALYAQAIIDRLSILYPEH